MKRRFTFRLLSIFPVLVLVTFTRVVNAQSCDSYEASKIAKKPSNSALTIAVASNFHFPLLKLIEGSTQWSHQNVRIVKASSGTLFAQITKGAPFDVFLSADTQRPTKLLEANLAHCTSIYAQGQLAIWPSVNNKGRLISEEDLRSHLNTLLNNELNTLSIANPELAPYGKAAHLLLDALIDTKSVKGNIVKGASVTQAFQFVDSANAKYGLIAESVLIQAKHRLKAEKYSYYQLIPKHFYPAILQGAAVLKRSSRPGDAIAFLQFIKSEESQQKLNELGYIHLQAFSEDE